MSKSNKHHLNWLKCPSITFFEDFIGERKRCPKRSCKGMCVEVLTRYQDHGLLHHEYECTTCVKVIKDYKTIEKENQNRPKRKGYYANNSRPSRFHKGSSVSR
jgi:hypothetical protein